MKLHYHPVSTTSRPLMMFIAESGMEMEMQVVDLFTGEHYKPTFDALNPNHLIPVLEDGSFRLTESSAILKYLAEKANSPLYPKDLQQRARINERMDWVNTQLCRDLVYGVVYPQIFPLHKRRSDEAQDATLQWGKERAQGWLKVLNDHILGGNHYVCGNSLSIADYFCAEYVYVGEITGSDFAAFPNVQQWLGRMKALKSWALVHQVIDGFGGTLNKASMVAA
ncbi:MAG: glutathione S-transferase family protein [Burkholderiaceae bacterium]